MTVDDLIFRLFLAAWLVVLALIFFVQLPRIAAQAIRIVRRLMAMVSDSPLPGQLAAAEANLDRIQRAGDRLPALIERAQTAVRVIRTTALMPAALGPTIARVKAEIRAFRAEYR